MRTAFALPPYRPEHAVLPIRGDLVAFGGLQLFADFSRLLPGMSLLSQTFLDHPRRTVNQGVVHLVRASIRVRWLRHRGVNVVGLSIPDTQARPIVAFYVFLALVQAYARRVILLTDLLYGWKLRLSPTTQQ